MTDGAATIAQLQSALRALRLNRHFPPWRAISEHLSGVALLPPGKTLRMGNNGLPHPDEWLRVRIDQRLAPELLTRLTGLEAVGDAPSIEKANYLRALQNITALQRGGLRVSLIELTPEQARYEVIIDRVELSVPSLVRWTLRLSEFEGSRMASDVLTARATERFTRRLQALTTQPALAAVVLLESEEGLIVEELVRGEVGPARAGQSGPWLSAVLSRISRQLASTSIDDPLTANMAIPRVDADLGLSHHRKWAAPRAEVSAAKAWLREQGSRNIVYGYR